MANPKKTYFLTPSFDYPPTGPILLGNILPDPQNPDHPRHRVPPPVDALITTTKTDWKAEISKGHSGSVGLYVKFLEMILGAGVDVGTNWSREKSDIYQFDTLETTFFDPTSIKGYLAKCIESQEIDRFLNKFGLKKRLYLVTGVKIVRGGKIATERKKSHGGNLDVGLDGTMLSAPVDFGPKLEGERTKKEGIEWGGSDDFVFAYRLSRLKVEKKTKEVTEEPHMKGALYSKDWVPNDDDVLEVTLEGDEKVWGEFGKGDFESGLVQRMDGDEDDEGEIGVVLPEKDEDEDEE